MSSPTSVIPSRRTAVQPSGTLPTVKATRLAELVVTVTSNDAPNAAMLAVNQRLGYQVVSEGVLVEGPARLG